MTDSRLHTLRNWLKALEASWELDLNTVTPASADASFRRYFRIQSKKLNFGTLIVMDALPEYEPLDAFIKVDLLLSEAGFKCTQNPRTKSCRAFLVAK